MIWNTVLLSLREIRRNILRSTLTVLGIVIGVAAVITMVTLGNGATEKVTSDIGDLGYNLIIVMPGVERRSGGGLMPGAEPFEIEDAEAVAAEIPSAAAVAPWASHPTLAVAGNRNWATVAQGSTNAFFQTRNQGVASGREFSPAEVRGGRAVCILGETVKNELYGAADPVGEKIRLGRMSYEIIGVLGSKGQSINGQDQDDLILLPLRTLQRRISGSRDVSLIFISAESEQAITRVKSAVGSLIRERRGVPAGAQDDFSVQDLKEISSLVEETSGLMTAFVASIAAVSLVVGGIGIMNTMLVTVTERTREIGTRLAIGAQERDVLLQFLVEATTLSAVGGAAGIALGLVGSVGLARYLDIPMALDLTAVCGAFVFSALVGVTFGFYPAYRAAQLNPIDALRYE